jgi:hypothetical protein
MADKKKPEFTVTDRRLFTPEGEVRSESGQEESRETSSTPAILDVSPKTSHPRAESQARETPSQPSAQQVPPAPSAEEQKTQADAYRQTTRDLDSRLKQELGSHQAADLQMTFERFLASLYMTALLQLGLVQEQGGRPQIDLIAARQTIDTIGILKEKTKGNLTSAEESFLQNVTYELQMAYLEVTNALARGPQPAGSGPKPK